MTSDHCPLACAAVWTIACAAMNAMAMDLALSYVQGWARLGWP